MQRVPLLAEEAGGLGALGFDITSLIVYLVNFLILLALLRAFAYKPFLRMMDQRAQKIQEGLELAERSKEEFSQVQTQIEEKLDEARQEGQRLVDEARQIAQRYRDEEEEKARMDAQEFLQKARRGIEQERERAVQEVVHEFSGLAMRAAERVVERSLDAEAHQKLIEQILKDNLEGSSNRHG